jgi:hypothetical protein
LPCSNPLWGPRRLRSHSLALGRAHGQPHGLLYPLAGCPPPDIAEHAGRSSRASPDSCHRRGPARAQRPGPECSRKSLSPPRRPPADNVPSELPRAQSQSAQSRATESIGPAEMGEKAAWCATVEIGICTGPTVRSHPNALDVGCLGTTGLRSSGSSGLPA